MPDPEPTPDLDPEAPADPTPAAAAAAPADTGARLRALFPALFGSRAKPIKLQIQQDIQERAPGAFSRRELSAFFSRHTRSTPYLIAVSRASERFGLDGEPSGALSDEHRNAALQELARRRANRQERDALADQQRRNRATLLRDFERTTLTAANFCALKGIAVDALEDLLATARQEAEARPAGPPAAARAPVPPGRRRPG